MLKAMAEKLPNKASAGPVYRVPVYRPIPLSLREYYEMGPVELEVIDFRAKPASIDGVEVTAWFYHDVLVKVSV
jgi:hypothetical protein